MDNFRAAGTICVTCDFTSLNNEHRYVEGDRVVEISSAKDGRKRRRRGEVVERKWISLRGNGVRDGESKSERGKAARSYRERQKEEKLGIKMACRERDGGGRRRRGQELE